MTATENLYIHTPKTQQIFGTILNQIFIISNNIKPHQLEASYL